MLVDDAAQVRQELADLRAALPAFLELVGRAEQLGVPFDEGELLVLEQLVGARLHVMLDELGLEVEQVLLRRTARHVQIDNALGLGCEVRRPGRHRVVGRTSRFRAAGVPGLGVKPNAAASRSRSDASAMAPSPVWDVFRNWRRVCARACCSVEGQVEVHGRQPLVKTPSRFKSTLATVVQAASSAGFDARRQRPDRVGGQ